MVQYLLKKGRFMNKIMYPSAALWLLLCHRSNDKADKLKCRDQANEPAATVEVGGFSKRQKTSPRKSGEVAETPELHQTVPLSLRFSTVTHQQRRHLLKWKN